MEKRYIVVEDRQQGAFGMGRAYTASEWLDQMLEWRDADDSFGDYKVPEGENSEDYVDTYEGCLNFWKKEVAEGREQDLINYIGEIWELEFGTYFEYNDKHYACQVEVDSYRLELPFVAYVYMLDWEDMPGDIIWKKHYKHFEDGEENGINDFLSEKGLDNNN